LWDLTYFTDQKELRKPVDSAWKSFRKGIVRTVTQMKEKSEDFQR